MLTFHCVLVAAEVFAEISGRLKVRILFSFSSEPTPLLFRPAFRFRSKNSPSSKNSPLSHLWLLVVSVVDFAHDSHFAFLRIRPADFAFIFLFDWIETQQSSHVVGQEAQVPCVTVWCRLWLSAYERGKAPRRC